MDSDKKVEPRTLKGFRDILPADALIKERMLQKIKNVFFSFGFAPIETPHLEYTEVLIGGTSEEIGKQLYRFNDQGDRDVCLRFDLTVPFARFVTQHKAELGVPFKRYAVGNVFRGEQPQFGRYREFTQCDFDFVGVDSLTADAEIVELIIAQMQGLGLKRFIVRINNRKSMNGLATYLGIPEKSSDMLRIIDKYDKVGRDGVRSELKQELNIDDKMVDEILDFVELSASGDILKLASAYKEKNELLKTGLEELETLSQILTDAGLAEYFKIDFTIARGLGYYTGIVYETNLLDLPEVGSVCSGGRYDNLTQNFTKEKLPGVGASIGLDRLIAALLKLELMQSSNTPAQVLLTLMDYKDSGAVHKIATSFRTNGIACEVYPEPAKLKKQFQYADRKGHKFVAVIGENELKSGAVSLRKVADGEHIDCSSLAEAVKVIQDS